VKARTRAKSSEKPEGKSGEKPAAPRRAAIARLVQTN
jgi:hypothetical protein